MLNTCHATEDVRTFMELIPDVLELRVFTAYPSLSGLLQRAFASESKGQRTEKVAEPDRVEIS